MATKKRPPCPTCKEPMGRLIYAPPSEGDPWRVVYWCVKCHHRVRVSEVTT